MKTVSDTFFTLLLKSVSDTPFLSLPLEGPGQWSHLDMTAGIDALLTACDRHGKAAACLAGDSATAIDWARRGFRMVSDS